MALLSGVSMVRHFQCRRISSTLGLVFILLMFACRGYCDVMMTSSESILVEGRATVRLPCEFEMVNFSMFQNPIIWNKRQAITEEEIQMNIMGNILEPFLSTHRFQASLENEERRYRMTLRITDFSPEDVGNYSCEVRGRKSVVLGKVQHSVSIKAPSTEINLEMANNSSPLVSTLLHEYPPSEHGGVLLFVENQFQPVSCTCRSFGPHQEVRILLGDVDVSSSFDEIKLTSFTGVKGLHIVQYTVIRTSFNLTFTALDDDRPITCSVSSPGTPANKTERLINVIHKPYIKCPESTAYPGETNVFLRCLVRARPPLTSLYWDFHHNDTTNKGNIHTPDVDDYWSTVTDRNDGWMETKFFMRHVNNQSFKNYKVVSENQLGVSSMLVKLRQISKPLPYESRLQSDNPSWHHKPNPSLEYMVIRSAPNRPSSVPASRSASFQVTVACVIFSISKDLRTSTRIFQFLLLKFWTVTSFCFSSSSSCLLGQP